MKKSTRRSLPLLRTAVRNDAKRIHDLIQQNQQAGHLLPRQLGELVAHIDRFVVGVDGRGAILGCGELAPLSHSVAELRSLVVTSTRRGEGLGRRIIDELRARAKAAGYDDLCVFTHQPAYFAHMGFSIVPHTWLPEKISVDCRTCALFRRCEQFAMVADLDAVIDIGPAAQLHV
jgi:amino-acid N-acetyltransferase